MISRWSKKPERGRGRLSARPDSTSITAEAAQVREWIAKRQHLIKEAGVTDRIGDGMMLRELGVSGQIRWTLLRQFVSAVVVPQLLFFLVLWQGPLVAAVGAGGGWTALLQLRALIHRRLGDPASLYGFVFTAGQAAAALVAHSATVYAGGAVAENLLDGLVLLGSVAISRPLLPAVTEWFLRQHTDAVLTLPVRTALSQLTLVWGLGSFVRALGLYVSLTHLALGPYLLMNTMVGWPLTGIGVLASVAYVQAQVRHGGRPRSGQRQMRPCLACPG